MKYSIINGALDIEGLPVALPGVPVQIEAHAGGLLVLVDLRTTDNNLFKINCYGEIEWQVSNLQGGSNYFRRFVVSREGILLFTKTNEIMIANSRTGHSKQLGLPVVPSFSPSPMVTVYG